MAGLDVLDGHIVRQAAGAYDLDAIRKDQRTHRSADEVVAVDEGVGDRLFLDDARNLGQP